MIVNSKFSSLYLGRKEDWKAPFDQDVCYLQKFALSEEIRVQFVGFTQGFTANYTNEKGVVTQLNVDLLLTDDGYDGKNLYEVMFSIDEKGIYKFTITNGLDEAYTYFCIKDISELENTVLLTYTHRKNQYDTVFYNNDDTRKVFNFRIEGGFYPGDKIQNIENEIFRDQRFDSYQTAAESYEVSTLTIGTKKGVPQWVGNKINNIFKLSEIVIDGIEATRNESSVPEGIIIGSYYPLYVFKFNVERPEEDRIYKRNNLRIFDKTYDNTYD